MKYNTTQSGQLVIVKEYNAKDITVKFLSTGNIKHHVSRSAILLGKVMDKKALSGGNGYYTDYDIKVSNQRIYTAWLTLNKEYEMYEKWYHFDEYYESWARNHYKEGYTLCEHFYTFHTSTNVGPNVSEYITRKINLLIVRLRKLLDLHEFQRYIDNRYRTPYMSYIGDLEKLTALTEHYSDSISETTGDIQQRLIVINGSLKKLLISI